MGNSLIQKDYIRKAEDNYDQLSADNVVIKIMLIQIKMVIMKSNIN